MQEQKISHPDKKPSLQAQDFGFALDLTASWLLAMYFLFLLPGQAHPKHWGKLLYPEKSKQSGLNLAGILPPEHTSSKDQPLGSDPQKSPPEKGFHKASAKAPRKKKVRLRPPSFPIKTPLLRARWFRRVRHRQQLKLQLPPIEVSSPSTLGFFLRSMKQTKRKKAVTRITFYGDSMILQDYIVGPFRRLMQRRFGDSGHGYITPTSPWTEYRYTHQNIHHRWSGRWKVWHLNTRRAPGGKFGLTGCLFSGKNAKSHFGSTTYGRTGRKISRVEVWYKKTKHPNYLSLRYRRINTKTWLKKKIATQGTGLGTLRLTLPEAAYRFTMRPGPHVKIYGIHVYRDKPGVIVDSAGLFGAVSLHLRAFNKRHWRRLLVKAKTKLIMLFFGANDANLLRKLGSRRFKKAMRYFLRELKETSDRVGSSCLVLGPSDRGTMRNDEIFTHPRVIRFRRMIRKEVLNAGCAYWDTFRAMGGFNSARRWRAMENPFIAADLIHITTPGSKVLGGILYNALVNATRGRIKLVKTKKRR